MSGEWNKNRITINSYQPLTIYSFKSPELLFHYFHSLLFYLFSVTLFSFIFVVASYVHTSNIHTYFNNFFLTNIYIFLPFLFWSWSYFSNAFLIGVGEGENNPLKIRFDDTGLFALWMFSWNWKFFLNSTWVFSKIIASSANAHRTGLLFSISGFSWFSSLKYRSLRFYLKFMLKCTRKQWRILVKLKYESAYRKWIDFI